MARMTTTWAARAMRDRGYRVHEGTPRVITGGSADSRTVQPGELFTAFPGENVDGNVFVPEAIERDAAVVICERAPADIPEATTLILAPNATVAVGELASAWLRECGPRVVGITGTVGKTTAKDLVAATLAARFRTHKSEGNFNSAEGLPLAVISLDSDDQVSVLEMGMDRRGEILELCAIARPEIGVVLNIGLTHVEKLGSIEAIAEEKLSLARWLDGDGTAVLNLDDPRIAPAAPGLIAKTIGFSVVGLPDARLTVRDVDDEHLEGTRFTALFDGKQARVHSPLPGLHTLPATLAALGVALALDMSLAEAAAAVSAADVQGRVRVLPGLNGSTLIDDRYNSSPASLAGALGLLGGLEGRRIALIGKMAELGEFEVEEHEKAGIVAATNADIIFAVGEACEPLVEAAQHVGHKDARWFADKNEAAQELATILQPGDHVLLKASRSQAFETLIPLLGGAQ